MKKKKIKWGVCPECGFPIEEGKKCDECSKAGRRKVTTSDCLAKGITESRPAKPELRTCPSDSLNAEKNEFLNIRDICIGIIHNRRYSRLNSIDLADGIWIQWHDYYEKKWKSMVVELERENKAYAEQLDSHIDAMIEADREIKKWKRMYDNCKGWIPKRKL